MNRHEIVTAQRHFGHVTPTLSAIALEARFVDVHRVDHRERHSLRSHALRRIRVGSYREDRALEQALGVGVEVQIIDRRGDGHSIGFAYLGQQIVNPVRNRTRPEELASLHLAGEATATSGELQVIQVDSLHFGVRKYRLHSLDPLLKQLVAVPALARASVDCDYLHGSLGV